MLDLTPLTSRACFYGLEIRCHLMPKNHFVEHEDVQNLVKLISYTKGLEKP